MTIESLPLTSLPSIILTTGPLVFLWTYLGIFVRKNGVFGWSETVYETHNFVVAAVSLVLAAYILDIGHDVLTVRTGFQVEPALLGYLYHLLKIYEYLDILLSVLAGNIQISKYTAFTHLALPYWSYYRVIQNNGLDWRFQVIADCFVRFLSRAVPWLIEDLRTEEVILSLAEEWRWYPDLAISAFWATFMFQDRRESEDALRLFGPPGKDETTARLLSLIVLLYASYTKRQEDASKTQPAKDKSAGEVSRETATAKSTSTNPGTASRASQRLKNKR